MNRRTLLSSIAALAFLPLTARLGFALDRPLTAEEEQMIREIGTHNSAIRTMAGRFLQIDSQGGRSEGTFFLERPSRIRFRYNPPSREEIISVGRGFYVVDRREQTQYAYPQDRIPLRQFLDSEINFFNTNIVAVSSSADYFTITLADDTPIGVVEVSLVFDSASKDLVQWSLVEPSGAELTFSLYDVQKNVEIPRSYFYIDPTYRSVEPQIR
ncbi:outer membrane lipoprotein carrier protein LolA [Arsenicitalea aurantiaca]|uniref:Outer membrane lipoprotein carrier protein LolA n=1 Tax=Arsenicitalea aurantiaca TaxID=1783274 RepID=A0A433X7T8_9HYPH|nr:outer membrane lipoprotein carrier protein LolA [Arsenicitalea aurantiaca]RUT30134.1 outer membrane lipoprotein carrier protein LolA [Arsenicitalea aurantiaca]